MNAGREQCVVCGLYGGHGHQPHLRGVNYDDRVSGAAAQLVFGHCPLCQAALAGTGANNPCPAFIVWPREDR